MSVTSAIQSFARTLRSELFETDEFNTRGGRIYFRLIELFLAGYAIHYCWTWGVYIQQNITSVLLPLGLANYVDVSFLFDHNVALVNAVLVAVLVLVAFFRLWRPAYLLALIAFHLQYVARFSLGEISHGSNLVGMGILGLGLGFLAFRSEANRRRFTFGFLYFFIGLGYTSAAFSKLIGTGLHWPDGRHLLMWIAEREVDTISKLGTFDPNLFQELVLSAYHVGTVALVFGLLAELVSFLMWWRKYRYVVVSLLAAMHIGTKISMNIFFPATTYLLILLAIPWHQVIDWGRTRLSRSATAPKKVA